jgi:ATP synthase protein I
MTDNKENAPLKELGERIAEAKGKAGSEQESAKRSGLSPMRVSLELFSGVLVGAVAGFYLDKWLSTSPVFMIVFFFLGAAAGVKNIARMFPDNSEDKTNEE